MDWKLNSQRYEIYEKKSSIPNEEDNLGTLSLLLSSVFLISRLLNENFSVVDTGDSTMERERAMCYRELMS